MNSSLLVPAFVVVALSAMGAVFFGDMFFGDATTPQSDYAVSQANHPSDSNGTNATKATETMASEFSWGDDDSDSDQRELLDTVAKEDESFVSTSTSTSSIDDAPGEVFSTSKVKESLGLSNTADTDKDAKSSFNEIASTSEVTSSASQDSKAISNQIDNDLNSFFDMSSKSKADTDTNQRSSISDRSETEFVSSPVSSDTSSKVKQSAVEDFSLQTSTSTTNNDDLNIDAFDFGKSSSAGDLADEPASVKTEPATPTRSQLQSVVSGEPNKTDQQPSTFNAKTDADDFMSGDLEPVVDSSFGQRSTSPSEKMVRKFKITNPKETTLPVTMSVDGEQITLKPDQTYVIKDNDGEVTVTFSRGGSFGFENKTLKNGHYRFSVTREAGWKLSN